MSNKEEEKNSDLFCVKKLKWETQQTSLKLKFDQRKKMFWAKLAAFMILHCDLSKCF